MKLFSKAGILLLAVITFASACGDSKEYSEDDGSSSVADSSESSSVVSDVDEAEDHTSDEGATQRSEREKTKMIPLPTILKKQLNALGMWGGNQQVQQEGVLEVQRGVQEIAC